MGDDVFYSRKLFLYDVLLGNSYPFKALLPALCVAVCLIASLWITPVYASKGVYQTREQFLQKAFATETVDKPAPELKTLWVIDEVQTAAEKILTHRFSQLRVRYWQRGERSAWILEEIGKVRPITFGVVVEADKIAQISVMNYRESRGGEVRLPFFTRQFEGLALALKQTGKNGDSESVEPLNASQSQNYELNGGVDGITGATLSVRAMTRIARLALYFHHVVSSE